MDGRQVRIKKAEGVRGLDYAYPGGALLVDNLVAKGLHSRPMHLWPVLALQFLEDGLGIFAKESQESVFDRMLGFTFVTVFVNRNPIDGLSVLVGPIGIPLVVLHVNAFVENLAEAYSD